MPNRLKRHVTARVRGFTLVELMIVVAIIAILATMALAAIDRIKERSAVSRTCNDLRQMATAFEHFAMVNGRWPADAAPGAIPSGMATYLPSAWRQRPAVGGRWEWDGEHDVKMVTLYNPTARLETFLRIDDVLDDGDPDAGIFRRNGTEWNYILEDRR
jgi:prepilin-type N-terminal cleavage/methylation domain-containing protein